MKKSIVISLLTVATLLCTAICSFASTGKVTTDTLRLRKEASTDSSTIALLSINDEVEILGEEYGWYKVKSGDKVGYVAAQYISILTNPNNSASENQNKDNNQEEPKEEETQTNNNENNNQNGENSNPEEETVPKETKKVLEAGEKLYITPLINSIVIDTLETEKEIEIVSEISGWTYVKIGTKAGWIRTDSIKEKEVEAQKPEENNNNENTSSQKIGYISGTSVNFRKTPNTSGEVIRKLARNAKVTIKNESDGWAEIEYDGDTGYVSTDYITDKPAETTSRSSVTRTAKTETKQDSTPSTAKEAAAEPKVTGNFTGADVVAYAKKYLGCKYVYGGSSPSGFDCSGFTSYVYKHFGVSLSRTSSGQASNGRKISNKSDLQVGDIVCFSSSSKSKTIGHVGIYIGGGKFIHAANSRKGVITSNVTGGGYYFVTASRVI